MVIMQRAHHVSGTQEIRRHLLQRLDAWDASKHQILAEDTLHYCKKFLLESRRDNLEEQSARTYTSLVLHEKLWATVCWITDWDWVKVYLTGDTYHNT